MGTIVCIFLILTSIEAFYIWYNWNKLVDVASMINNGIRNGLSENYVRKYNMVILTLGIFIKQVQSYIWIPISFVLFFNFVLSSLFGGIIILLF